jgi:hypothetical protein
MVSKVDKERAILKIKINIEKIILGLSEDSFLLFKDISLGLLLQAKRKAINKEIDTFQITKNFKNPEDWGIYNNLKDNLYELFLIISTHRHGYLFNSETASSKKIKIYINNLKYLHTKRIIYTHKTYKDYNDFDIKNNISEYNVLFHGSGDGEIKKYSSNLILSKINSFLSVTSHSEIYDGPSAILGKGFTRLLTDACNNFLKNYSSEKSICIIGHSRGACRAIGYYNFITALLKKQENNLNFISRVLDLNYRNLVDFQNKIQNIDNLKIKIVLLDPVSGPRTFPFNHKGFDIIDIMKSQGIKTDLYILRVGSVSKNFFDLHVPELSSDISSYIIKISNSNHGKLVRYASDIKQNYGVEKKIVEFILNVCGAYDMNSDFINDENHTTFNNKYSKYSKKNRNKISFIQEVE